MERLFWILDFVIHLAFACLREAPPPEALRRAGASAKAGVLAFELYDKGGLKD